MGSHLKLRLKQEAVLNSIFADLLLMTAQQNIKKKIMVDPKGPKVINTCLANDTYITIFLQKSIKKLYILFNYPKYLAIKQMLNLIHNATKLRQSHT